MSNSSSDWFQLAFTKYYRELVLYAERYLYDRSESEDIVQETFVKLWENRSQINIHTSARGYLYSMVRNRCLNYLKSIKITDDLEILQLTHNVDTIAESQLEMEIDSLKFEKVKNIMQMMPNSMKEIFELKYLSHLSCTEIATELNISSNTVKTQLKRAKARIFDVINCILITISSINF